MSGLHIIWFRHDLRVHDHAALRAACQATERDGGSVLALYIAGAAYQDGANATELRFLHQSLEDLRSALQQRDALLHVRSGDPAVVLSEIHRAHGVSSLHTHELSGDDPHQHLLEGWAMRAGVPFRVYPQFGPDQGSTELWGDYMSRPRFETPDLTETANVGIGQWLDPVAANEDAKALKGAPIGGRRRAIELMRGFLGTVSDTQRIASQQTESGAVFYDTLKPYLTLGVLSVREVWQAATSSQQHAKRAGQEIRAASIESLLRRLPELSRRKHGFAGGTGPTRRAEKPVQTKAEDRQLSLGL